MSGLGVFQDFKEQGSRAPAASSRGMGLSLPEAAQDDKTKRFTGAEGASSGGALPVGRLSEPTHRERRAEEQSEEEFSELFFARFNSFSMRSE